jgi:outer membrane protein assembly factor BamE (lipoprotein component of BamABCDE complex)
VRPDPDSFSNGRTTYSQVIAKLGPPRQEGSVIKNEKTLKTVSYVYASMGGQPLNAGATAARAAGFYFLDDVLVGHEFVSSWAEDHTNFDESRVKDIARGKSTRADVIQLMGKPGGYHAFPLIKDKSGEAALYAYMEVKGFTPFRKELRVTFDSAGVVTDVEFSSTGTK